MGNSDSSTAAKLRKEKGLIYDRQSGHSSMWEGVQSQEARKSLSTIHETASQSTEQYTDQAVIEDISLRYSSRTAQMALKQQVSNPMYGQISGPLSSEIEAPTPEVTHVGETHEALDMLTAALVDDEQPETALYAVARRRERRHSASSFCSSSSSSKSSKSSNSDGPPLPPHIMEEVPAPAQSAISYQSSVPEPLETGASWLEGISRSPQRSFISGQSSVIASERSAARSFKRMSSNMPRPPQAPPVFVPPPPPPPPLSGLVIENPEAPPPPPPPPPPEPVQANVSFIPHANAAAESTEGSGRAKLKIEHHRERPAEFHDAANTAPALNLQYTEVIREVEPIQRPGTSVPSSTTSQNRSPAMVQQQQPSYRPTSTIQSSTSRAVIPPTPLQPQPQPQPQPPSIIQITHSQPASVIPYHYINNLTGDAQSAQGKATILTHYGADYQQKTTPEVQPQWRTGTAELDDRGPMYHQTVRIHGGEHPVEYDSYHQGLFNYKTAEGYHTNEQKVKVIDTISY